jgi:N-acetylmuramoyl-L-alanine amidase
MTLTHPSPNHSDRRGNDVELIVLHCDASPNERGTISWIQSAESKVSYHALIGRDGTIYTFVPYDRMAWHAGKSEYQGRKHCNLYSVGLSFANRNNGKEALTPAQIDGMKALVADIRRRYGPIPVTTHTAIAPGRKTDPENAPGFRLEDYV